MKNVPNIIIKITKLNSKVLTFFEPLKNLLTSFNEYQCICLLLIGNFNAKLSKLYTCDKDTKIGQDILTATASYSQVINQVARGISGNFYDIDLLFISNRIFFTEFKVQQSLFQ